MATELANKGDRRFPRAAYRRIMNCAVIYNLEIWEWYHLAYCAICGRNRKLTKEHVPPEKAYNDSPLLLRYVIQYEQAGEIHLKEQSSGGAFVKKTICEKCNNNTGGWYGDAYVQFSKQMAQYADRCAVETVLEPHMDIMLNKVLSYRILVNLGIYPARVAKQALCMFCVTCQPVLTKAYPEMRKRILDKKSKGRISDLRLWLYIRETHGGKITGLGIRHNIFSGRTFPCSEVSFWPAGWVLTFKGEEMPKLWEATHWLDYDYDDQFSLLAHLPHGTSTSDMDLVWDLPKYDLLRRSK